MRPAPDRAVVFQESDQLFPWRTVMDNVAYTLRVMGWGRDESEEKAVWYLKMTSLDEAAYHSPHQLSGA